MKESKAILVSGAHRSGSTWVGQVLSKAPNYAYLHEPFNPIYTSVKGAEIDLWYQYLNENSGNAYKQFVERLLKWDYQARYRIANVRSWPQLRSLIKYSLICAKARNQGQSMILKDPIALFSAPWLYSEFGVQPLILVRHPAAFAYSLIRKDWYFPFADLLKQPELMQRELSDFQTDIEKASEHPIDLIDQAVLVWRIFYHYIKNLKERFPQWQYVRHEDLSTDPLAEFEKLFRSLDLEFNEAVRQFIIQSSSASIVGTSGDEEQLKRDSRRSTKYWKEKLSEEEIEHIKSGTSDIWPSFYQEKDW